MSDFFSLTTSRMTATSIFNAVTFLNAISNAVIYIIQTSRFQIMLAAEKVKRLRKSQWMEKFLMTPFSNLLFYFYFKLQFCYIFSAFTLCLLLLNLYKRNKIIFFLHIMIEIKPKLTHSYWKLTWAYSHIRCAEDSTMWTGTLKNIVEKKSDLKRNTLL